MSKGTVYKSVLLVCVVHWYLVGFRETRDSKSYVDIIYIDIIYIATV